MDFDFDDVSSMARLFSPEYQPFIRLQEAKQISTVYSDILFAEMRGAQGALLFVELIYAIHSLGQVSLSTNSYYLPFKFLYSLVE